MRMLRDAPTSKDYKPVNPKDISVADLNKQASSVKINLEMIGEEDIRIMAFDTLRTDGKSRVPDSVLPKPPVS
jgi:hypothetical protein